MKLEQEANAHINKKRNIFKRDFNNLIKSLRNSLKDNLHSTSDLDNALLHLVEAELWTQRSIELWGIK